MFTWQDSCLFYCSKLHVKYSCRQFQFIQLKFCAERNTLNTYKGRRREGESVHMSLRKLKILSVHEKRKYLLLTLPSHASTFSNIFVMLYAWKTWMFDGMAQYRASSLSVFITFKQDFVVLSEKHIIFCVNFFFLREDKNVSNIMMVWKLKPGS